jgi:hypothetical protein
MNRIWKGDREKKTLGFKAINKHKYKTTITKQSRKASRIIPHQTT